MIIVILTNVRQYPIVVLVFISLMVSLMINDVEHPYMCPLAICMSSEEMSARSFARFLIRLFVCLVLSCVSSLYVLDISPLSDISLANTFSHSIGCLFHLVNVFNLQLLS